MITKSLLICLIISLSIVSCNSQKTNSQKLKSRADNSKTSLDWNGIYQGILPCADCKGIKTQITINQDLSYVLETQYLGKSDSIYKETGSFSWNENGSSIIFDNSNRQQFLVGENLLFHLDNKGKRIEGELAEKYVLTKEKAELDGKHWTLVRLNGKQVSGMQREPFINFNAQESRASGNSGCNNYSCGYELTGTDGIKFGNILSTKMACIGDWNENDYFIVMEKTVAFSLTANELVLQDIYETSLAVFKSDFFK